MKPILIGICGGSGSGKSTVTEQLLKNTGGARCTVIRQDNYYKDQSHLSPEERVKTNYDHPFAFDNDLFIEHLMALKSGKSVDMPEYDFSVHNRKKVLCQPLGSLVKTRLLFVFLKAIHHRSFEQTKSNLVRK